MKCNFLFVFVTALLALATLVTTSVDATKDAEALDGPLRINREPVLRSFNSSAKGADKSGDLVNGENGNGVPSSILMPTTFANSTTLNPASGNVALQSNKIIADIRMGREKVYIGTLRKGRLFDEIYKCLKQLCPIDNGLTLCQEERPFDGISCEIDRRIVFSDGDSYETDDSKLYLQFRAVRHRPQKVGLDLATYELVAGIYQTMSDRQENCYKVDIIGSRRTLLCNVSSQVLVAFPAPEGDGKNVQTLFIANLSYNRKWNKGGLNCDASVMPTSDWFNNNIKKKLAVIMGMKADDIFPRVNCVGPIGTAPNTWWDFKDLPNQGDAE